MGGNQKPGEDTDEKDGGEDRLTICVLVVISWEEEEEEEKKRESKEEAKEKKKSKWNQQQLKRIGKKPKQFYSKEKSESEKPKAAQEASGRKIRGDGLSWHCVRPMKSSQRRSASLLWVLSG